MPYTAGSPYPQKYEFGARLEDWEVTGVCEWASDQLQLPQDVVDLLRENEVNGRVLATLTEMDMESMGFDHPGFRRRLFLGVADFRCNAILPIILCEGSESSESGVMTEKTILPVPSMASVQPVSSRPPKGTVLKLLGRIEEKCQSHPQQAQGQAQPEQASSSESIVQTEHGANGETQDQCAVDEGSPSNVAAEKSARFAEDAPISKADSFEDSPPNEDSVFFDLLNPFDLEDDMIVPAVTVTSPGAEDNRKVAFLDNPIRHSSGSSSLPPVLTQESELWQDVTAPSAKSRSSRLRLSESTVRDKIIEEDLEYEAEQAREAEEAEHARRNSADSMAYVQELSVEHQGRDSSSRASTVQSVQEEDVPPHKISAESTGAFDEQRLYFDMFNPFDFEDTGPTKKAPNVTVTSPEGNADRRVTVRASQMSSQMSYLSRQGSDEMISTGSEFWQDLTAPSSRHGDSRLRLSQSSMREQLRRESESQEDVTKSTSLLSLFEHNLSAKAV